MHSVARKIFTYGLKIACKNITGFLKIIIMCINGLFGIFTLHVSSVQTNFYTYNCIHYSSAIIGEHATLYTWEKPNIVLSIVDLILESGQFISVILRFFWSTNSNALKLISLIISLESLRCCRMPKCTVGFRNFKYLLSVLILVFCFTWKLCVCWFELSSSTCFDDIFWNAWSQGTFRQRLYSVMFCSMLALSQRCLNVIFKSQKQCLTVSVCSSSLKR